MNPLRNLLSHKKYQSGGRDLTRGGTEEVARYQEFLNSRGANLEVDGAWGPKTQKAYEQLVVKPVSKKTEVPTTKADTVQKRVNMSFGRQSQDTPAYPMGKGLSSLGFGPRQDTPQLVPQRVMQIPRKQPLANPSIKSIAQLFNLTPTGQNPAQITPFSTYLQQNMPDMSEMYGAPAARPKYVDDEIINTQDKRNLSGQFSEKAWEKRGVLNRSYDNRLYDTDKKLYELIQSGKIDPKNFVYVDIGSGLGNEKGQVNKNPGATIKDLLSRKQLPTSFNIYATDLPGEVKDFKENPNATRLWELGQGRLKVQPIDGFNPNFSFLKGEKKNTVFIRAANSVDKLMTKDDAIKHFEKIANDLANKEVYYLYHNYLLYKPKKDNYFKIIDKINPGGFDSNKIYTPGKSDFSFNNNNKPNKKSYLKDIYKQKNNIA